MFFLALSAILSMGQSMPVYRIHIHIERNTMEIISVAIRRGGVAKTETSLNLAAGLHRSGKRVLMIDLDPQCCLSAHLGIDPEEVPTIYEVISGDIPTADAITETTEGDIICGSPELSLLERKEHISADTLQAVLKPIRRRYDYIIMDTAPALGNVLVTALTASTSVLIPTEPRQSGINAIIQLYDTIEAVRQNTNRKLKILGILITRCKIRTILTRDMRLNLEELAESIDTKVFQTIIRDCNAFGESEAMQQSIFQYAPRSNGAADYKALIQEILQEGD